LLRSLINTQMNVGTNQVTRSRKHTWADNTVAKQKKKRQTAANKS
jgi:hypothetical protein